MAITVVSRPKFRLNVNNPILYTLDSTRKNEYRMKYVVIVKMRDFETGTTLKQVAKLKYVPNPNDNNKVTFDLSPVLKNIFTKIEHQFPSSFDKWNDILKEIEISYTEEYSYSWTFNDYYFADGGGHTWLSTSTTWNGSNSNELHLFQPGNQIKVEIDSFTTGTNLDSYFDGYYEVESIKDGNKTVVINKSYPLSGFASGKITYADNRVITSADSQPNPHTYHIFYSTFGLQEYVSEGNNLEEYDLAEIFLGSYVNQNFLTNAPADFSLTTEQDFWLSAYGYYLVTEIGSIRPASLIFRVYNPNNNTEWADAQINPQTWDTHSIIQLNVGVEALLNDYNYYQGDPSFLNSVSQYGVRLTNTLGRTLLPVTGAIMQKTFKIDRRCKVNDIQITFLDKMGSMGSFAFQLKRYNDISVKKDSYETYTDVTNTYDIGKKFMNSQVERTLRLNTNWMSEEDNKYFEELLSSELSYIQLDGVWYNVEILTNSTQTEYSRNNKLIRKTIEVRPTIKENIKWKND